MTALHQPRMTSVVTVRQRCGRDIDSKKDMVLSIALELRQYSNEELPAVMCRHVPVYRTPCSFTAMIFRIE